MIEMLHSTSQRSLEFAKYDRFRQQIEIVTNNMDPGAYLGGKGGKGGNCSPEIFSDTTSLQTEILKL